MWAIFGVIVTVVLATSKGHPPGLIYAPFSLAFWLIGHLLLWFSYKLAIKGNHSSNIGNNTVEKWPLTILFLTFLFGAVFIIGFFAIVAKIIFENDWKNELSILLLIWLPPSICFVGILLRQTWSRYFAGVGFILVALLLLYQMIESLMRNTRVSTIEWIIAIVILIILLFLGQHILRSSSAKAFLSK